jgi:hypothetical protein
VLGAAATIPLLLAAVGGLGGAAWWVLTLLRPAYRSLDWGTTYRPDWYEAGLTVLAVTGTVAWYVLLRRWLTTVEATLGVLAWLAGSAAVAGAFLAPGAAYLLTWPALVGSAGLALGLRLADHDSAWPALGGSAAALVAASLWQPVYALGLADAAAPMTLVALLAATAMPAADLLLPRRAFTLPASASPWRYCCWAWVFASTSSMPSTPGRPAWFTPSTPIARRHCG